MEAKFKSDQWLLPGDSLGLERLVTEASSAPGAENGLWCLLGHLVSEVSRLEMHSCVKSSRLRVPQLQGFA